MGNDLAGDTTSRILTVGHSTHDWPRFLQLLRQAAVTAVADVRSQPHSRWCPQFNRPELERSLPEQHMAYVFLGEELGGRPRDLGLYDDEGRVRYEWVRNHSLFQQGLARLLEALHRFRVVLLCSEEDPLDCHRGLMIAPALVERGQLPAHLRGDGSIESMAQFEERLLEKTGVAVGLLDGLFADQVTAEQRRACLDEAYRQQGRRRAFRLRREQEC
jgi:uncharacterized protein (DUF488 family)